MDMAKNVNLDKQVDGLLKSWGVAPLINHIPLDVHLVTSLERVEWLEQMRVKNKDTAPASLQVWELLAKSGNPKDTYEKELKT